jgi:lysyl-tRNA synthetase class 2
MSNQEHQLIANRRAKLANRRNACPEGESVFPNQLQNRESLLNSVAINSRFDSVSELADLENEERYVSFAGRVMIKRGPFVVVQDATGRTQFYANKKECDPEIFQEVKGWDIGDIVEGSGYVNRSKTGDLYIKVDNARLLTKSLRPLPDKFYGLEDQETRYRQRYVDLMVNEETRETFVLRSRIVSSIRRFMELHNFMEVETPMLQTIPGGATASPFMTHHNALDMDMYLRIAPELYLKRLIVGGFERVFEINKNFRNEGLSTRHNPEFTMLEFYMAYSTYHDMMDMTIYMIRYVAENVFGNSVIQYGENHFDVNEPFNIMTMREALIEHIDGLSSDFPESREFLSSFATENGIEVNDSWGSGRIKAELFENFVEKNLIHPTFITEYPTEVSPLARTNDENPEVSDRFEFFIGGREIANGFSELNDAEDQASRFKAQVEQRDSGDDEAMYFDADYINALEYGMPPTAGMGIGIDRLVMFFANANSIKDVILFPTMRSS